MTKKVLALLIACFLIVPTLAACGTPSNNGNQCQEDDDDD